VFMANSPAPPVLVGAAAEAVDEPVWVPEVVVAGAAVAEEPVAEATLVVLDW
jgi:hypothetical protein